MGVVFKSNKRMKIKKLLTIFVMALIISLPISFATTLTVTRSSGNDNIDNYYDGLAGDNWIIEVEAGVGVTLRTQDIWAAFLTSEFYEELSISN